MHHVGVLLQWHARHFAGGLMDFRPAKFTVVDPHPPYQDPKVHRAQSSPAFHPNNYPSSNCAQDHGEVPY